jgi:hypothetical protein
MHSPWRVAAPLVRLGKLMVRELVFLPFARFATRHCELEASKSIFLPLCTFLYFFFFV